ncbi:MAG TPA: NAD+ synthase [Chitinophagales bacterium]|nr:NAD+ synthase [Chitinophagales bacterium]HMU98143.1 NAD+ synthase [Chitinophagales bacterium]HMV02692.1 NAD+ synthase [Chitinophagales bacterium]HMW94714.1 NAD+ synthase [Chitinophagales bacterium]HMY42592.1 NAD+ synthase [Chitinophagales bacterium]
MKIALAQQNYIIGDFEGNFEKISDAIDQAIQQNTDLILFSELAICGYPPRDFLYFNHFIEQCELIINRICAIAQDRIAVVIGAPSKNPIPDGKDLYNSAYFIENGKVKHITHKTLLPTYDVFDEYRYFESNRTFELVEYKGKKIAITICEDIWDTGETNPLYTVNPVEELAKLQPDFLLNLSASPFNYKQAIKRIEIVSRNASAFNIPIFYCNNTGAQTELIFDGGSLVIDNQGRLIDELPYFRTAQKYYELDVNNTIQIINDIQNSNTKDEMALIHDAIICGIKDYFGKLGLKKAILGLSGGIDSALTLYFAVKALGKQNVLSVLMPSQYSTNHSVDDSLKLVENLDTSYKIIPIKEAFDVLDKILQPHFDGKPFDVTEENMQARIRAIYLMALSNKHGYVLLNTTNKSEAAVGYGTLYGDMCGGLAVLADIYKTQVYDLCRWINRNDEIIPKNIIEKAPSAELRPNQKDSDSLPDYEILDRVLFEYIENIKGPDEIRQILGFEEALIDRILKLVNRAEFKRHQTPPILRISPRAFGSGRRVPIVNKYCQ